MIAILDDEADAAHHAEAIGLNRAKPAHPVRVLELTRGPSLNP